jgi:hypothetical protein
MEESGGSAAAARLARSLSRFLATTAFGGISSISGFGVDGHGEMYIVTISATVYKITEAP